MLLLDEGVPKIIQKRLPHLQIFTVEELGWRGIKNGQLLQLMDGQFNILVTTDKNLRYQQNLEHRGISVIILPTNQIPLVLLLIPEIEDAFAAAQPETFRELCLCLPCSPHLVDARWSHRKQICRLFIIKPTACRSHASPRILHKDWFSEPMIREGVAEFFIEDGLAGDQV